MKTADVIQAALAFGTVLAGMAASISTYFSYRAMRRLEDHDIPKATVGIAEDAGVSRNRTVVVSNVGFVPFTVVEVVVGGSPIRHDGMEYVEDSTQRGIRTVMPGAHALFEIPRGHAIGPAAVRIASGLVFTSEG